MAAFVLGNGKSRAGIDINQLMLMGPVYGCNAIYRTHRPTVLVATDKNISAEIQNSGYARENQFYTRRPLPDSGAKRVPQSYFGFSSGPIAMALAAADRHDTIYLLGFDMGPSENGRFNNVYADTEHYRKSEGLPVYTGNWVRQMAQVARDHPQQRFVRIHAPLVAEIPEFKNINNLGRMDLAAFVDLINTSKDR